MGLRLQASDTSAVESSQKLCNMVKRQAGCCKVVGILILNAIHFSRNAEEYTLDRAVVLKLFVAADPFHCTPNRCRDLRFVKVFSIIDKLVLAVS